MICTSQYLIKLIFTCIGKILNSKSFSNVSFKSKFIIIASFNFQKYSLITMHDILE